MIISNLEASNCEKELKSDELQKQLAIIDKENSEKTLEIVKLSEVLM